MDKIATENLFLLEFLVDKVEIDSSISRDVGDCMGDTCVSVQFLDNAPLDICEDDFTPKRNYGRDTGNLKSGKSCLFSLTPSQAEEATRQFDVYVDIFKKMQPGILPDKVQVGNSLISIVSLFNELVESLAAPGGQSPTAKTLKDTFKITDTTGQYIGDIGKGKGKKGSRGSDGGSRSRGSQSGEGKRGSKDKDTGVSFGGPGNFIGEKPPKCQPEPQISYCSMYSADSYCEPCGTKRSCTKPWKPSCRIWC